MDQIAQALALVGLADYVRRQNTGAAWLPGRNGQPQLVRFGTPGGSDFQGPIPPTGRFLAIEAKRSGQKPTAAQWAYLRRVNQAGGVGFYYDGRGDLVEQLRAIVAGGRVVIDDDGQQWLYRKEQSGCTA